MLNADKAEWLKNIGAKEFLEPIKYVYTFPGYNGAFNLSERYVEDTDLEELKAQYEKNKAHVLNMDMENMNWVALAIPKDCHYIFVCASESVFDERIKHGMKKLYDNRNEQCETSLPCFIGYSPSADLKDLDTLAGISKQTNNAVGFEMNQKMTIEYDKGCGYCTVKMTKIEVPKWGSGNGVGNTNIKKSQYELEEQKRIQEKNKKIAHYIGTIFLSMITAIIVTTGVLLYTR